MKKCEGERQGEPGKYHMMMVKATLPSASELCHLSSCDNIHQALAILPPLHFVCVWGGGGGGGGGVWVCGCVRGQPRNEHRHTTIIGKIEACSYCPLCMLLAHSVHMNMCSFESSEDTYTHSCTCLTHGWSSSFCGMLVHIFVCTYYVYILIMRFKALHLLGLLYISRNNSQHNVFSSGSRE